MEKIHNIYIIFWTEINIRALIEGMYNMGNFCTNCGAKLGNDYNYCINCGAKLDNSDIKQNNSSLNSLHPNYEKEKVKNEFKRIVGGRIFFKETFSDELLRNGLSFYTGTIIKEKLEKEIESGQIKSGEVEHRMNQLIQEYKIKKDHEIAEEEARIAKEKEMRSKKIENSAQTRGGYCSFNCIHYCEEFLDSQGGIVGDFDSGGYTEYYCNLGHNLSKGNYCKDYE